MIIVYILFISLESEIEVQHIIEALHIEILRIEAVVSFHTLAVDKSCLLITSSLYHTVVGDVLEIELTEVGTELYSDLKEFVNYESEILFKAKALAKKQKKIRIGVYSSLASSILPKILKNLKKDIPELNISINVLSQEFRQSMKNNTVDIIFSSDQYGFDCEWLPLFEEPYFVAIPESYNLDVKTIEKDKLYDYPLIQTEKLIFKKHFDLSKFKEIIDYKTEEFSLAIDMVKEGVGVTLVPTFARIFAQVVFPMPRLPVKR